MTATPPESTTPEPALEPGLKQYTVRLDYPVQAKSYADAMRRFGLALLTHGIGQLFFRVLEKGDPDARIFQDGEQVSTDQANLDYLREVAAEQGLTLPRITPETTPTGS